jgi:response regulator RpfG family c-di-GMP phosphodiesterase
MAAKVRAHGNGHRNGGTYEHDAPDEDGHQELTPQEIAELRTYPRAGALIVRQADALLPKEIAYWIECQDEHFDGTGFPRGLKGEEIPLPSRIIAVAREYVRLTIGSDGSYQTQTDAALRSLRSQSGTLYDPSLVGSLEQLVPSEERKYR